MNQKMIGRYIVSDPRICHGKPTFRGTRIMVSQVLEQVAMGMAWETIAGEWRGDVSKEAIGEAVRLASQAFAEHADEYTLELAAA
jgi:uncharacterized protein (DUF433 family)